MGNLKMNQVCARLLRATRCLITLVFVLASPFASAALNFSFNAADESSRQGEAFQLEWIVVNDGSSQENNISVEVPMPGTGINSIFESDLDGGDCSSNTCTAGEVIVWSLGNIPAGESRMATFSLTVANAAPNAPIMMEGRLKRGSSTVATSSWPQQVSAALVAELSIDSSVAHVESGSSFSYGVLAGNTGTSPLNGAQLTVPIPSSLTITSAPGGLIAGNTVTWNLGNLSAGRVTKRVINVMPNSGLGTGDLIVLDNATLSGTVFGITQSTLADHVVTVGNPSLKFELRAQETHFTPGEVQNIEFLISNTTNQVIQNTSVQLMYPERLSGIFESESGGDCSSNTCNPGEKMTWFFGNLLPGETKQIAFETGAGSNFIQGRPVRWQASARIGSNVVRREYLATGNTSIDVNLQIDSDETRVSAGDVYTYTLNVGNVGPNPLDTVALRAPVPDNVTVLESYGGSLSSGVVTWQLSSVPSGGVTHRYLKVRADTGLPNGTLINLIDAEASTTVFGIPEASMAQHFVAIGDAPIDVELRLQQVTTRPGESFQLEIVASNTGAQVEQNVIATLLYPDDLASKFESNLDVAGCASNTCDPGERMIVPFGNLVPGETKSIVIGLTTLSASELGEHITWMGTVSAAGGLSRRFEATTAITDVAAELQITADSLLVEPGANVTYQIASGNSGGVGAGILSQVTLTVPIPEGMTVIATPGGSVQDGRAVYSLPDIDDKGIYLSQLILGVPEGAPNGTQFALENVELSGFLFGLEQMTYASHVVTVGNSPITGQISVTPQDAKAGDAIQISIDVVNSGSQVEQNVVAFLRYPTGVASRFETDMDGGQCPSNTCDAEEGVVWSLGNLLPGGSGSINFNSTISNSQLEGDMIEWALRLQASGVKQRRVEFGSFVGFPTVGPVQDDDEFCNGQLVTVDVSLGESATSGNDVILGTSGDDIIFAFGGNDTICALGGHDTIFSGNGDDWIDAGPGDDEVQGSNGVDVIYGDDGNDNLNGGPGNDDISGENGDDTISGNSGSDFIDGGDGVDAIKGGSGNDTIETGSGATVGSGVIVDGGSGNDTITGGADADEIRGSTDDDIIMGGGGNDRLFGGGGFDEVNGQSGDDFIRGNAANDTLSGGSGNDNVDGGTGRDTVLGGAGDDRVAGATGNDLLRGQSGDDTVIGGGGNDQLFGDGGVDLLQGGGGNDVLNGGGSSDTCDGQSGTDVASLCETLLNIP